MKPTKAIALAIALFVPPALFAQTTGRIVGHVVDNTNAPMPGVVITVTGPSLPGAQTATSDGSGNFRFPSLPPGDYKVKAEIAGFKTMEETGVRIGLDRTATLAFTMQVAPVAEVVTVEGTAPLIDVTSTTTGVNATADLFNRIPLRRDIYAVARVAPGTQDDGVGPTFYGSTGAENQYIIEGLNTTGIEAGGQAKTLNFDFVQEVEVKTGGLQAEYGRITGGVINVLTKSGGNDFHGSVFGFNEGGGLQSDNTTATQRPQTTTTVGDVGKRWDVGGELGGYLVKDKLWFFGAYNHSGQTDNTTVIRGLAPGAPTLGSVVPLDITRHYFAGKLTYRLNNDHSVTASVFGDPSNREGNIFAIAGPASTWRGTLDTGSTDYVARYDGNLGNSFLIRALGGRHQEKSITGGPGKTQTQLLDQTVSPNLRSGGFAFYQDEKLNRNVFKVDLTKFAGSHELKLGGDLEDINTDISRSYGGGQLIYALIQRSTGIRYFRHRYYVNDRAAGFSTSDPSTWQFANPLNSAPSTKNYSAYLQDSWKVTHGLTLNLGLRWERQNLLDRDNTTAIDLKKNWAPRLGFVWDVANNGKSKAYANFGRFYEAIPQDINIRSFGGEVLCFCYNFDSSPSNPRPLTTTPSRSSLLGGSKEPVDPNLKGQYIDEYLAGYEYEVAPNLVVGVKGSYRKLGRVIEDFLVPSEGNYFVANPGEGTLGQTLAFYDGVSRTPSPKAKRDNYSLELTARKRFADHWQLLASYVFNKLEGNYDGLYQNATGQLDPNINSAFDYADFLVNAQGPLSIDSRHQFKLDGSYEFSGGLEGLNLGLSTHFYSGVPENAYGYSFAYANWEYYLAPRGSVGRHPADWEADLHASYPFKVGKTVRINVIADLFNVFNRQAITQYDERYNLVQDGACGGVPEAICNGDGGIAALPNSLTPVGSIPNPRATATNPDYLKKGISFTGQRSLRFGVRVTF